MYCIRCGTQNREGANFCKHCGVKLDKEIPAQKKKKKTGLVAGIIAAVVAFAVAFVAFGGTGKADSAPKEPNPDYVEVFTSRGLNATPSTFSTEKSIHFVTVTEEKLVEKLEFGYDKDLITEMVNVVYVPMEGYTAAEWLYVDDVMHDTFASFEDQDFITVSYFQEGDFYVVSIRATDLDNIANVAFLKEFGFESSGALLSAKESAKALKNNGYIQR